MTKILIVIKGGNIQWVYSTEVIEYLVLDHDNIDAGDEVPTMEFIREQDDIFTEWQMQDYLTTVKVHNTLLENDNCDLADLVVKEKIKFSEAATYLKSKKL